MTFEADLHVHTVASNHAYSTVTEIATAAARKGLKMVAMTDHGPAMPGGPHVYHFSNMIALPESIAGVRILKGVEANIYLQHQQIRQYLKLCQTCRFGKEA